MSLRASLVAALAVALASIVVAAGGAPARPPAVTTPRLYVLDGGTLEGGDLSRFQLEPSEVATTDMSVAAYLVVHPRGTLVWDAGAVPDADVTPGAGAVRHRVVLPNGQQRFITLSRRLVDQIKAAGYAPADITYLALSHYHYDHTANANAFARATWLVRQVERDAMLGARPADLTQPSTYDALRSSRTTIIDRDDYDVFGDGSVVIKFAPGHTPGHQVLFVRLAHTGPLLLSGDLYHYPEERTLGRVPTFDADPAQTRRTRQAIDAFLRASGARLWIQHDLRAHAALRKAPQYYD